MYQSNKSKHATPWCDIRGIVSDHDGNMYIAVHNQSNCSYLIKYDASGNYLGASAQDCNEDGAGWRKIIGLTYSETTGVIYASTESQVEDCVYAFGRDLSAIGATVGPSPGGTNAKGIAITKECCPVNLNVVVDTVLCDATVGTQLFLQDLIGCEGAICEGVWGVDPSNSGIIYDACDNSISVTNPNGCGIFTLSSDGVGSNKQCAAFSITLNIILTETLERVITGDQIVCSGDAPSEITSTGETSALVSYQWQESTTSCVSGFTNITGSNSPNYSPPNLTQTTYYRLRTLNSGTCGTGACVDTSNCVTITVDNGCVECSVDITSASAANCSGTGPFFADWNIEIDIVDAPDNSMSYQRNSETIQSHTLIGTTATLIVPNIPADGGVYDTLKVWFTNDVTCADTILVKRPLPCPTDLGSNPGEICNVVAATEISGSIWEDWNYDGGINEATINGFMGIQVELTDGCDENFVATTYTDASGNYQFTGLTSGTDYRVEFTIPESILCWAKPTKAGNNNGTTVQFIQPGTCASLGLADPIDYCQEDPLLMIPCYVRGGGPGTDDVVVRWTYSNNGLLPGDKIKVSEDGQVGALWGMAYNRNEKLAYASAILKSHTALHEGAGGGGLDAIFSIDPLSPTNGTVWLELEDDLGIDVGQSLVPTNAIRGLGAAVQHDSDVYPLIGTVGIGDIDISSDSKTLYLMNLFDRTLYAIDIATKSVVESYPIPDPGCTNGTYRPWAIEYHNGKVFVGSICDASTTGKDATASDALTNALGRSDLHAYVYRLDESGFTEVLDFSLDYNKQPPHGTWGNHTLVEGWFPWTNDMPLTATGFPSGGIFRNYHSYPTPILSDIVFDDDGSMVLAFADRTAFQIGDENYGPNTSDLEYHSIFSGGDLLRACKIGTDWVIEGTANSCTNSGGHAIGSATGYYTNSVGEYYEGDFFDSDNPGTAAVAPFGHPETAIGSAILLRGKGELMAVNFDPISGDSYFKRGGVVVMDNQSGNYVSGFQVYDDTPTTFGKGAGLGDLIALCNAGPIEIGNYVWEDTDKDGIQDACESGIDGITIELVKGVTVIAATQTANGGQYYFSSESSSDPNLTWTGTGADTALIANTAYTVRITNALGASQQSSLSGFIFTDTNANSNNSDNIDSDAIQNGNTAQISVTTGDYGCMDHSLDFGFYLDCPLITNITPDPSICTGDLIDSLTVTTFLENPDNVDFVYFTTQQADSIVIYTTGTSLGTEQVALGNDTVRINDIAFPANTGSTPQTYYVYAIAQPAPTEIDCRPYAEILVTVNPLPVANAGTDENICNGNSTTLSVSGGTAYNWSPATGLSATNISNPVANPTTTTTYSVTVTDTNGCTDVDDVLITVDPLPTANAGIDVAYCIGGSTTLSASGGSTYAWSPATGLSATNISNPVANPITTTTYSVTVTDGNGCTDIDDVLITVYPLPPANAGSDTEICFGESTTLSASGGVSYSWSPATGLSATNVANPVATPTVTTTYSVTITDGNTCVNTDDVTITVNSLPTVTAFTTNSTCTGPAINDDGIITLVGFTTEKYDFNLGSTYTGSANYASANSIPAGGEIANSLPNPLMDQDYTVRIFNTDDCFEDRVVTINTIACIIYDYGDLPDLSSSTATGDYQTDSLNNGPGHLIIIGLFLGDLVDEDTLFQGTSLADGDDLNGDDEDGLRFYSSMEFLPNGNVKIPLSVTNTTSDTAHIEMWIDWNGDGDFDDTNEMVTDLNDGNGTTPLPSFLTLDIPEDATQDQSLGLRIRLSNEDNMTPYGLINSGEVEDYMIQVTCKEACLKFSQTSNQ